MFVYHHLWAVESTGSPWASALCSQRSGTGRLFHEAEVRA